MKYEKDVEVLIAAGAVGIRNVRRARSGSDMVWLSKDQAEHLVKVLPGILAQRFAGNSLEELLDSPLNVLNK